MYDDFLTVETYPIEMDQMISDCAAELMQRAGIEIS
jgi:hypothetical protein